MGRDEFENYIISIGFKKTKTLDFRYLYKNYGIDLYGDFYKFYTNLGWVLYVLDDLSPLDKYFKNELRSIKLKKILG